MRYNIIDASDSVLLVWLLLPRYAIAGYLLTIFGGCMASRLISSALPLSAFSLTLEIVLTVLFYLAFLLLSRSLTKEDVHWIFSAFRG